MNSLELSDEQIAQGIQDGDHELFSQIVERYEPKLKRYASKFLRQSLDTEDVLQEVFIKAYRNIQSFDTSRKFSSWIYRIAHNEFINFIKKRRIETVPLFDTDVIIPYKEDYDLNLTRQELKIALDSTLDKIDLKYREPILLYYIEEFSYKEISDILHIPVATVGVRINRGKKLLKDSYTKLTGNHG